MNTVDLGEICDFVYGKSLPVAKREDGPVPVFGSNGIVGSHTGALSKSETIIVGRKGSVGKLNYSPVSCWPIDTTYYIDRDSTSENIRWLFYALHSLHLPDLNRATGVPGLNRNDAYAKKIVCPSRPEQRRIADILDKADAIRRKRERALNLADDFLKSVFLEMFGDPHSNTSSWDMGVISDCLTSTVGGWSAKGDARPAQVDELGVLKISAVTSGDYLPEENKTVSIVPEGKKLVVPQVGDLLFSRANTRELVAATCIVTDAPQNVFLPDKLWKLEVDPEVVTAPYLKYVLADPGYRYALCLRASGTSGSRLNISKAKLLDHPIPIPPIQKQKDFEKIWWRTQETVKRLKLELEMSNELFGSLSQRAFSGGL
jgi:type I restriction enzyme S subunit